MKKILIAVCTLCMLLINTTAAFGSGRQITPPSGSQNANSIFEQIRQQNNQMTQGLAKYQEKLNQLNQESNLTGKYIQQAESLHAQAANSKKPTPMPPSMKAFMDEKNLSYGRPGVNGLMDEKQWNIALNSLQTHLEHIGMNIQTVMMQMQDFMGSYNSSGQRTGASLFSTAGTGAMDTPLVATSLLAGIGIGMFTMWILERKRLKGEVK